MTELPLQQLAPDFCTAPQLTPEAMAAIAAAGFKSVINNRPDFEGGPDQPTSEAMASAARAVGLEYRHLPVSGGYQSPDEIAAMRALIDTLPRPILAFCRSGARSGKLFRSAEAL
ncbi:TIGR01244 family sulfur transferase [Pelomonas sp. SE-A7]|uniref:TIGR01244 family sulfur transferase n=1 Tax=Pelomonas sp. SE-A7 TaxID=3054953 RepID=UPI00259CE1C3|nr:TIGR01244 family sulfur transferase [Pelomonas sp. SE-A7]MDM4765351.1 TIGR01244 family sulfur transferase [Pelomonas sp. SE-A7]